MAETRQVLPFSALSDAGLLWFVNAAAFHPRGVALTISYDGEGNAIGWYLQGGDDEPWHFEDSPEIDERYRAANATIKAAGGC